MTLKFALKNDLLSSSSFFGQQSFVFLKITFLVTGIKISNTSFGELGWGGDIIQCYKLLRSRQHCLNIKAKGFSLSESAVPSRGEHHSHLMLGLL